MPKEREVIEAIYYREAAPWGNVVTFGLEDLDDEAVWHRWLSVQRSFVGLLVGGDNATIIGSTYYSDKTASEAQANALKSCLARTTRLTAYMGRLFLDNVHWVGGESQFVLSTDVSLEELVDVEYAVNVSSLSVLMGYSGPDDLDAIFTDLGPTSTTEEIAIRLLDACDAIVLLADDGNVTQILSRSDLQDRFVEAYLGLAKHVSIKEISG